MRIFLVRHGQSVANTDWSENTRVADHAIELTEEGHRQAQEAGKFLSEYFAKNLTSKTSITGLLERDPDAKRVPKIRLWHSPYKRTRQTAAAILETCRAPFGIAIDGAENRTKGMKWFLDQREHLLLHEQQFGVFDGLSDEEREKHYPREQAYYEKCKKYEGKLWPKLPLGESRFEVCQRVHQSFGTFHRDTARHGIENIVVVGHGTTNRAFVQMWMHKRWEWMHEEKNPQNCSVRLIEDGEDKGYIFDGFPNPEGYKHKTNKETEE